MSEPERGQDQAELASVDPDEQQFRADTLLMHAELVELELYAIRRWLFADPDLRRVSIGAGNPAEQTLRGYQRDPFNGVVIYNPTPATLSIGFQAGAGYLAPLVVPPFSWVSVPERYVNLSIALLILADQQATIANPVTVLRTKFPPSSGAGPYGLSAPLAPVVSLPAGSAGTGLGVVLDNGVPRANHSLVVVTSAGVTAGGVRLVGSLDGINFANIGGAISTNAANAVFSTSAAGIPMRYVAASITSAIVGGSITATVASA